MKIKMCVLFIVMIIFSCSSANDVNNIKNGTNGHNAYFVLSSRILSDKKSTNTTYSFFGNVNTNHIKGINAGKLIFCDITFLPYLNETELWDYTKVEFYPEDVEKPGFGKVSKFYLEGNDKYGIPEIVDSFYVPNEIVLHPPENNKINRNDTLHLFWDRDEYSDSVTVHIMTIINLRDSIISKRIEDSGEFHLDISKIDFGQNVMVEIHREFEKLINKNNMSFYFAVNFIAYNNFVIE